MALPESDIFRRALDAKIIAIEHEATALLFDGIRRHDSQIDAAISKAEAASAYANTLQVLEEFGREEANLFKIVAHVT